LARRSSAHAIGDHEERVSRADLVIPDLRRQARVAAGEIGDEKGILVVISGAPKIGLAEHRDTYRAVGHPELRTRCLSRPSAIGRPAATARVTRAIPSGDPVGVGEGGTNLESAPEGVNVRLA